MLTENMNIKEALRYLGYTDYNNVDDKTKSVINECIQEILKEIKPRYTYGFYDIEFGETSILVKNTDISLSGKNIRSHLENCEKCVIMASTMGPEMDKLISKYEITDMAKAVVMDAIASVAIEDVQDAGVAEVRKFTDAKNLYTTNCYSPGYGDLSIALSVKMIHVLNAQKKIGLTVTPNNILIPRKSITSFIGVSTNKVLGKLAGCENCVLKKDCKYRKRGVFCESV